MAITNESELRSTYLHVYDSFATDPSEIAHTLDINVRFARELLATLVNANLVVETEGEMGTVWQCWQTHDDIDREEAEYLFDNWIETTNHTNQENTVSKPDKTEKPAKPAKEQTFHPCYCGCTENVPSKSFYRPGHDARHAGRIGRLVAEDGNTDHYSDLPSERLVAKAQGITEKALAKAQAKADRAAAKTTPEVVEGTLTVGKNERIGRKFKDGTVEYMDEKGEWKPASKTAASTFEA